MLVQILYDKNSLLTHSDFEYQEGLLIKISDYREDELFYYTVYEYDNTTLMYAKETRLSSAGVRFGTSPLTYEYRYVYEKNGNLLKKDVSYQSGKYNEGVSYKYPKNTSLPNQYGDSSIRYEYFD